MKLWTSLQLFDQIHNHINGTTQNTAYSEQGDDSRPQESRKDISKESIQDFQEMPMSVGNTRNSGQLKNKTYCS